MALISATELALKTLVEDGDPSAFEPAACPLTALVAGGLAMAAAERACLRARRDEANGEVFLGGKAVRGALALAMGARWTAGTEKRDTLGSTGARMPS